MTKQNAAILSEFPPAATPVKHEPDRQRTLPVGPTGRVHRGGITDSKIQAGQAFWKSVNAVDFSSRGSGRRSVYRAVAWHVALTEDRICYAAVETIAKKANMGATQTRVHLQALETDGFLVVEGQRSGGRKATSYRMTTLQSAPNPPVTVSQPSGNRSVNPPVTGAEVGTEEYVQAADSIRTTNTQKAEKELCLRSTIAQSAPEKTDTHGAPVLSKPARHTCPRCGHTWPASYGPDCYAKGCGWKRSTALGGSAPTPGKYDGLCGDDELDPEDVGDAKPDPPPLEPHDDRVQREARLEAELVANAVARGYRRVAGLWTTAW